MRRKPVTEMSAWPSLILEGNLIAPAMVAQIYAYSAPEQSEENYRIRKGLTIREEISTAFRVGQSHFDAFMKIQTPSAETTRRFCKGFLEQTFGFDDLEVGAGVTAFIAGGRVPIVVVPPFEEKLDRRSPTLSVDRTRSPAYALQDYLNEHEEALWGLVTNGTQIRLMRDNASLTRPAYIEADLNQIFQNEDAASFAVLWLLIHRTRFGSAGLSSSDCALERWRDTGSREGATARDKLAAQVEIALKVLGSGFLDINPDLAQRLKSGEINLTDWFNELLRLVYRLIVLMVAEDRNLLHPENSSAEARKLYAEGYSLTQLRAQCFRAATWDKHHDRYEAVKVVFNALSQGQSALALPALDGLFAEDCLPRLRAARLRNSAFMEALYRLSWLADGKVMVPVNWRAMETEELGSVYESLLELQPQLGDDGKTLLFASEAAEQRGNQRKTTGSYYTPDSLVEALLDSALDPLLNKTEAEADDPARELLKLSIIDPACGSGHFLLAAARRIATRLARIRADGTPSLADFRHALRDVARCCIYGTDLNPMAVELTKVALWIETIDPGLPLGFFDAQIRCGNALLGIFDLNVMQRGIPDAAYNPLTGDDRDTARYYLQANRAARAGQGGFDFGAGNASMPAMKPLALDFTCFRDLPEDTVEQIGTKAERFRQLRNTEAFVKAKTAADLYIAAFLLPKTGGAPAGASSRTVPTTEELWMALNHGKVLGAIGDASNAAHDARALHWPLEFPDVMQRGGFDAVIGNPPWERIKLQEQEFFAARSPDIASASNKTAREKLIKALQKSVSGSADRTLFDEFVRTKRAAEAISEFVHVPGTEFGRFTFTGRGDVNTYALFAELFANLAYQRAGMIVPTGIATDATTAPFFAYLVEKQRLAQLVDFENRDRLFPAVDSRMKFCMLTLGRNEPLAHFAFFLTSPVQLAEPQRNFTLSPSNISAINPNTKTAPIFRTRYDAEIVNKIYLRSVPIHSDEGGAHPWAVRIKRYFDMNRSEILSICRMHPNSEDVPVWEGKLFWQYDNRHGNYNGGVLQEFSTDQKNDPYVTSTPRYWTSKQEVVQRLSRDSWHQSWLIGLRDFTNVTNERTVIASVIPFGATDYTVRTLLAKNAMVATLFLGCVNTLIFDFVARNKLGGTHLSEFIFKQLPFLPEQFFDEKRSQFLRDRVIELSYTSHNLASFAHDLGYDGPPFSWDEGRRANLRADIDAFYARAYGLTRDELRYVLEPADIKGPDYPSETFRVLMDKETRQYGEYRTRRLVLDAWDRMVSSGEFTAMGL